MGGNGKLRWFRTPTRYHVPPELAFNSYRERMQCLASIGWKRLLLDDPLLREDAEFAPGVELLDRMDDLELDDPRYPNGYSEG